MEIVKIDLLDPQSLQALISDCLRVLQYPVWTNQAIRTELSLQHDLASEFGCTTKPAARTVQRLSERNLVFIRTVQFGGVR